jgi:hypothetical protein
VEGKQRNDVTQRRSWAGRGEAASCWRRGFRRLAAELLPCTNIGATDKKEAGNADQA